MAGPASHSEVVDRVRESVWTCGPAFFGVEGGVPRISWVYFSLVTLKYWSEN